MPSLNIEPPRFVISGNVPLDTVDKSYVQKKTRDIRTHIQKFDDVMNQQLKQRFKSFEPRRQKFNDLINKQLQRIKSSEQKGD